MRRTLATLTLSAVAVLTTTLTASATTTDGTTMNPMSSTCCRIG